MSLYCLVTKEREKIVPKHQVSMGQLMSVDWTDCKSVITMAKRLGPGQTVFKCDDLNTYGITHTSRPDRWDRPGVRVVFRT